MLQLIYPGTFNPFHQGHAAVVRAALQNLPQAHVVVVPTGQPPHRTDTLADPEHRLAMARLALADLPRVSVSDEECVRPGPHYTAVTLQRMELAGPLGLLLGKDALLSLPTWYQADWLGQHIRLFVVNRGTEQTLPVLPDFFNDKPPVHWFDVTVHPASATAIRAAISDDKVLPDDWLDEKVKRYIIQNNLYTQ